VCQIKANLAGVSFVFSAKKKARLILHVELKKKVQMKKQQKNRE
jgi:hypothetical protein